jgi:chromosome partitioning protein
MIYTTGGIKGGSGKSTVATNLVTYLVSQGRDVILIDGDDQGSATDFTAMRNSEHNLSDYAAVRLSGQAVFQQVPQLVKKYQDIVIDTGGRDTDTQRYAMLLSHIFLVPFKPRSVDIWTLGNVEELITQARIQNPNLKAFTFLSQADSQGKDNDDAGAVLQNSEVLEYISSPLVNRKAFSNAFGQGLGVIELKPRDFKATEEVTNLFQKIVQ